MYIHIVQCTVYRIASFAISLTVGHKCHNKHISEVSSTII